MCHCPTCQELKQQIKDAKENMAKDPQARPYFLETVEREAQMEARVTRAFILLSSYDFEKVSGKPPRARDPRCPQVEVQDIDGTKQRFYAFVDPQRPFRQLELSASVGEVRSEELMPQSSHVHPNQAFQTEFQQSRTARRLQLSGCGGLLQKRQMHLCTVAEYEETMGCYSRTWTDPEWHLEWQTKSDT